MRPFRSTIIFAFVVFLVVYVSYREYRRQIGHEEEQEQKEKLIQNWEVDEVQKISVKASHGQFQLKKAGEVWNLVEPLLDLASKEKVEDYIRTLFKKKAKILLNKSEEKKIIWSDYGLETPQYTFELTKEVQKNSLQKEDKKGKEHKGDKKSEKQESMSASSEIFRVDLSSLKSYDGKHFLRLYSEDGLYIAQDSWTDVVSSFDLETFREKQFFLQDWIPNHFVFQVGRKAFEFQRKGKDWVFLKDESLKLDSSFLDQMISQIQKLKASELLSEITKPERLSKFQLNRPRWLIKLSYFDPGQKKGKQKEKMDSGDKKAKEEEEKWQMKLSPIKNKSVYLQSSDRNYIGKISETEVKKWPKRLSDFRDKNAPFSFDSKQVFFISLFWNGKNLEFRRERKDKNDKNEEKEWKFVNAESSDERVDEANLRSFLRQVSHLKAEDFLKRSSSTRVRGKNKILIQDESGQTLLELLWDRRASRRKLSGEKKGKNFYFLRSQKVKDILLVKEKSLEDILDIKLTKKEAKVKDLKEEKKEELDEKKPKGDKSSKSSMMFPMDEGVLGKIA